MSYTDLLARRVRASGAAGLDVLPEAYSNPGDTVFTAFGGVGSELYVAVKLGRKAIGIELKPSYWATGCQYLRKLESEMEAPSLFDEAVR